MHSSDYWIEKLGLLPHPEGGFYKETYRSKTSVSISEFQGKRVCSTGIYFLLNSGNFSAFHRIKSDEMWHFYQGGGLEIFYFEQDTLKTICLGNEPEKGQVFQALVPAGVWFAARPLPGTSYALVGCTVSPGFDFRDFEMAKREELTTAYPKHSDLILELCID